MDIIRRQVYSFYERKTVPTISSLHKKLKEDNSEIKLSEATLRRYLLKMGFAYKRIEKQNKLMESQRIREARNQYLNETKKYREENRCIVYLDETWYDTHDTVSKGWTDLSGNCIMQVPTNKGKRITILHAGTENGWIPNTLFLSAKNINHCNLDYHEDTTGEVFEEWFKNKLLNNVPERSVIVMDNAKYHSRQLNKVPNNSNTKLQIQEFLQKNDIYFEENYSKKQLLEVLSISKNNIFVIQLRNKTDTQSCVFRLTIVFLMQ